MRCIQFSHNMQKGNSNIVGVYNDFDACIQVDNSMYMSKWIKLLCSILHA